MNKFRGTPGPWSQGFLLNTPKTIAWSEEQRKRGQRAESLLVVANFRIEDEGRGRQRVAICEHSADAKLIAAAPQMLEALQALLSIQEEEPNRAGFWWVRNMPTHEMLTKAKAALSAALD